MLRVVEEEPHGFPPGYSIEHTRLLKADGKLIWQSVLWQRCIPVSIFRGPSRKRNRKHLRKSLNNGNSGFLQA